MNLLPNPHVAENNAREEGKQMTERVWNKTMKGENINLLSESEWRTIHNALSVYQSQQTAGTSALRVKLQQLMDKVRDNYIT